MEERNGWQRALLATRIYDVDVIYCDSKTDRAVIDEQMAALTPPGGSWVAHHLPGSKFTQRLLSREATFYLGYRRWQKEVFSRSQELHSQSPFSIAHTATLCGYREPGFLMNLNVPHLWGPIGGTQNYEMAYRDLLDGPNLLRELIRSTINLCQLRLSRRVGNALRKSFVLTATEETRQDLIKTRKQETLVDLETGVDYTVPVPRHARDPQEPIRLLWSGRLRSWKGLPLLLMALRDLSHDVRFQLRVVGNGPCQRAWKRMAKNYDISDRIEWIPWEYYRDTLEHYSWADAFVFTSLRDTSGTGLVEALAAGTPIIGFDHQGAADMLRCGTGLPIPVSNTSQSVIDISQAIERLAKNSDLWLRLSRQCQATAIDLAWCNRGASIENLYGCTVQHWKSKQIQTSQRVSASDRAEDHVAETNGKVLNNNFSHPESANALPSGRPLVSLDKFDRPAKPKMELTELL